MDPEIERSNASSNFTKLAFEFSASLKKREAEIPNRLKKSKASNENKLKYLYEFMDEINSFTSKYTACKKGCSHCCSYEVAISEIEIQYIEKHTKNKRNKQYLKPGNFHGSDCSFLKDGKCSIYIARPYACRRHVALTKTNYWCQPSISKTEAFPLLQYSGIDGGYDFILRESNTRELVDIRQVFGSE